ncbi:hypothetical protein [Cryobacterium sp. PH29-G1]|nr:hypothetical protein [Cryobacterium sp. PH29-G1]MDJ0350017.1 hypothetical protein [Cryobacterium sp. PH29-G1]
MRHVAKTMGLNAAGADPVPFTLLASLIIGLGAVALTVGRRRGRTGLVR